VPGGGTEYSFAFREGVPQSINYGIYPRTVQVNVNHDAGLFVQDRWTTGRWTLSGGLRFDAYANSFPAQSIAPTYLAPRLNVSFPEIKNASWKDITPKMGLTYDLFGNGKTALKVTANKYLEGLGTTGGISDGPNPILALANSGSRAWADNGDFVPQCNLQNYSANGECGALSTADTFGTVLGGTKYDPEMLNGWGKRGYNWEFTGSVQQELIPRMSVEVQYARRLYGNFRVNDDLGVTAADYDTFTYATPKDSRLPNGGGQTLHFVDAKPTARPESVFVRLAKDLDLKQTEHFDGVNLTVNSRLQNGLLIQGGLGTGRVVTNDCEVVAALPETLHQFFGGNQRGAGAWFFPGRSVEDCQQNNGWRTQLQGLAAYTIPKADVQISGTFQNLPGARVNANTILGGSGSFCVVLGICAPTSLVRDMPNGLLGGRIFNVTQAGDLYNERLSQLDFRVSKIFRFGSKRTNINFDFYNVMNANSVIGENAAYGATWRTPQSILVPRLFKFSAQFDF
jgi:hypothetical protein